MLGEASWVITTGLILDIEARATFVTTPDFIPIPYMFSAAI